jgi:hypothetical protein
MEGYVRLHRSLPEWEWYHDDACLRLLIHLLMRANWKAARWKGIDVEPGQMITSMDRMSDTLGWSRAKLRRTLDKLKSSGDVATKAANKFTLVTLVNWAKYQQVEQQSGQQTDQQTANKRPASDTTSGQQVSQQAATIEEGKKERRKESKKEKKEEDANASGASAEVRGDVRINECWEALKVANDGLLDGSVAKERRACYNLLRKMETLYPEYDATKSVLALIKKVKEDAFHGKNATSFTYLFNNLAKIINAIKQPSSAVRPEQLSVAEKARLAIQANAEFHASQRDAGPSYWDQ